MCLSSGAWLLLELRVPHPPQYGDPLRHGRMSCKGVGEEPLVAREPPPQGIGYTQMRRPALDVGRRGLRALDLLQRARQVERVARELRRHVIRHVFPLPVTAPRPQLDDYSA